MNTELIPIERARTERLGGISRVLLYKLVNRGDLKKVNIGRRSFILSDSIDAYIESLREAA